MKERDKERAVIVKGAIKQYGNGKKAVKVLDRLDMNVQKGTIYGLLGASGCGKTTLLSCIIGRRQLNSGDVWVLGGAPGTKESGAPGPRIGYMPQELSLMRQFSVWDCIQHFGWIYGLSEPEIKERFEFLTKLLNLPPSNRFVMNLSGGQQRRLSLAVALVHEPELLILDEPTVGLDPVLRQTIWEHLVDLSRYNNVTIIITTHYIQEAVQANTIGLLRHGKLLAEDSPSNLLALYNCSSIEDVFVELSGRQESKRHVNSKTKEVDVEGENVTQDAMEMETVEIASSSRVETVCASPCRERRREITANNNQINATEEPREGVIGRLASAMCFSSRGHAKALITKNIYRIIRHPGAILFCFLFPMLEICTFFLAVGHLPEGLKLGVVNEELGNFSNCEDYTSFYQSSIGGKPSINDVGLRSCSFFGLSCRFLNSFNDSIASKTYYDDIDEAKGRVKTGELIGVINFPANFTSYFEERLDYGTDSDDDVIQGSELPVWLDMTVRQSAMILQGQLIQLHRTFVQEMMTECGYKSRVGALPITIEEPVHGENHNSFIRFMAPGVLVTMMFFLATGVTSTIIVLERSDGLWERTICAGVTQAEILASHIVVESFVILMQAIEVFLFAFCLFKLPYVGDLFMLFVLLVLQGICGMCCGFLVSVSSNEVRTTTWISLGSFYPILLLSGLIWPIEGMTPGLKQLALCLPTTLPTTAVRNILEKGWGLSYIQVSQGFLVTIAWIVIFMAASFIVMRVRKL